MNLVGDLKEKVEKAESKEEAKQLIQDAGIELTEEEMEQVAGGYNPTMAVKFGKIIQIIISTNNSNDCEWRCRDGTSHFFPMVFILAARPASLCSFFYACEGACTTRITECSAANLSIKYVHYFWVYAIIIENNMNGGCFYAKYQTYFRFEKLYQCSE